MMIVKDIITRVRSAVHDKQQADYSDEVLLGYINDAIRFIRRTIIPLNPMLIADKTFAGTLEAGNNKITLTDTTTDEDNNEVSTTYRASSICDIRVDGRELQYIQLSEIKDTTQTGKPAYYYMVGYSEVRVYPVPTQAVKYDITIVSDFNILTSTSDTTPVPYDLDDFILEYCGLRVSLTNEYDMSQEQTIFASIVQQIETFAKGLAPSAVQTLGYWNGTELGRDDYGWR